MPIDAYVAMLARDLEAQRAFIQGREISSIFFGGGTPSLFPAKAIGAILATVWQLFGRPQRDIEITLETNPGTAEYSDFDALRATGVNRLSFGAQSFDDQQLRTLGRIHSSKEIVKAVTKAKQSGFTDFNIDLMHGLPKQTQADALSDLEQALALEPTHLSWYQLTIEPNTAFYSSPPQLPDDDQQYDIYRAGRALLTEAGFGQYEVSAYAKADHPSRHNLNYWQFGDYLAAGAGAHGKVTLLDENKIVRFQHTRQPKDYLARDNVEPINLNPINTAELPLEFMMNALRLSKGVDIRIFSERTGIEIAPMLPLINELRNKSWFVNDKNRLQVTEAGHYYLNNVLEAFMPEDN